ncbi:MAG: AP2 domain-containing protein [Candidatus Moraniibacteriota bacterium]
MHEKGKKKSLYGICRVDNDANRTHGWLVTIQRRGKKYRKLFSDKKHRGKAAAFVAAKCYRDRIIAKHPLMKLERYMAIQRMNNRSGVVGVGRYVTSETKTFPPDKQRWYWVASWTRPDGSRGRAKFSVAKYGDKEAYKMAFDARKKALKAIQGVFDPGRKARDWEP